MAGRISLALLILGTAVLSLGMAVGVGLRLAGGAGRAGAFETVAERALPAGSAILSAAAEISRPGAGVRHEAVNGQPLLRFHTALRELESGQRQRPVTILHLGDGHLAGDRLDGHMRHLLQSRFGDAGRGLLLPAGALKGYRTRGLRLETTGSWKTASALEPATAVLGITGVQASATSPQAEMSVAMTEGRFDAVEVAFLSGPDRGAASIVVDGRPHSLVTRSAEVGVQRARLPTGGTSLTVKPSGTGPITVLSWSLLKSRAGVRYIGIGWPGASIEAVERLDELVLIDDLRALKPDLVILGYGASEAMDDRLDVARYRERFGGLLRLLQSVAPEAAFAIIAPPDVNRVPEFAARLRGNASTGCQALSAQDRLDYAKLMAAGDERLARWYTPPRLDDVRQALQKVAAAQGAFYWDWSRLMGGECGMHTWVHAKPELALPDHVTLTDEGYQRSARALFADLVQGYEVAPPPVSAAAAAVPATGGKQAARRWGTSAR